MNNYKNLSVATGAFWIFILYFVCCSIVSVQSMHHHSHKSPTTEEPSTTEHHHRRHREGRQHTRPCEEQVEDIARMKELRGGSTRCRCGDIHAPACGSDGITYHNRCYLECASAETYHRFRQRKITLEKWGPCEESVRAYERTTSSSSGTGFGLNFWVKECAFINKRENCTPAVKSFCTSDFPQVVHPPVNVLTK